MAETRMPVKRRLAEWLEQVRPERISEALFRELLRSLAPVSESRLRRLLRRSALPLDPLVEGVCQDDFASLERTLTAIGEEYRQAMSAGDRARATACRRLVIEAKDHARLVVRNPRVGPEKKAEKSEMLLWMMTWLENPGVFEDWLRLRKQALRVAPAGSIPQPPGSDKIC